MSQPPDDRIIAARISGTHEPSAVLLVRRIEVLTDDFVDGKWRAMVRYEVPAIERVPGGSSRSLVADVIGDLADDARDARADRTSIVADITVPGLPFLKLLQPRKVRAVPVMVGDAAVPRADRQMWNLPARELVSIALATIAEARLAIADVEGAQQLAEQLEAYRIKQPPRDALSEWRPTAHTDLAGALMLATWWGERMLRTLVKQPPPKREPIKIRQPTFNEAIEELDRRRRDARG